MKTRMSFKNLILGFAVLFSMMYGATSYSQACTGNKVTITLANIQTTATTIEYDVVLNNTGTNRLRLAMFGGNVIYGTAVTGTPTLTVVDQPSAGLFPGFNAVTPNVAAATRQLRWTNNPVAAGAAVEMPANTAMKFARFRATNTNGWGTSQSLTFPTSSTGGITLNVGVAYCSPDGTNFNGTSTPISLALNTLTLTGPYTANFVTCATSGVASNLGAVTCFGGNNGSATVTMSPVPSNSSITYTVDGGASTPATLVSGAFNVTGLTAGAHSIVVSNTSCSDVTVPVTISGPSGPLTNTTTQSACGSYTWGVTGLTYTESGTYSGTTTNGQGCTVNETLNLTITPNTTNGSETQTACDSYTWAANGQTYTSSGTYTFVSGCNTATLNLTITPSTTNTTSQTACDSYTWSVNGQTYTSSGTYTNTVGCHTEVLNLTITPSTSNTTSQTACDSYTWSVNGQTYTSSGSYSSTVGCHTEVLNLTITPSTSNTSSASACDSYTWSVNGQTYTSSGSYSSVTGCHTEILNLTITPSTTNTTSQSACDSYTWSVNGTTYASSGTYSNTVGCHTEVLNLTITPSTSNTTSETACGSFTWSVNGQTYTSSGTYTSVSGCHTEILNLTINTSAQTYYADTDGDGFGAGAAILSCTGQPANTSTNNTDCAPADPTKWRTGLFYTDADGDGYNNGFPQSSVCYGAATPAGYTLVNLGTDCNDELATVNPNASEIPGNNIDDNCDGNIDEVYPTSFLNSTSCGVTLTNLANQLYAYQLSTYVNSTGIPVQGYRFEVTNGSNVRTYESTASSFNLMNLAGGATYATTYSVRVSVKVQGFWRAYGSTCTVTTPAVPNSTNISQPACGSTLANISNTIYCGAVSNATGYRFRVRNGSVVVGTFDATVNRFSLTDLGIQNISFATTYTIDVLLRFGTTWRPDSEYGSVCSITTPATPGASKVINPACGTTITRLWTSIYAQQVIGAQGYKFVVTSTSPATSRQYTTSNSVFSLMNLPGGAQPGVTYTIRVDVLYNSSYVQGTQTCDITVSPAATRQTATAINVFDVKSYPNPFADNFKLELNSSSENEVSVRVYDMLGREVESNVSSVSALSNLEIGSRYPSGVYNIIVTQGDNVKTLRVIKR